MSVDCLRLTELPGTWPLFEDLVYNYARVERFYPHAPSLEAVRQVASEIHLDAHHRRALVEELGRQNVGGNKPVSENLDRLADSKTVVVVAGQQVGLYGGPVFTLYKVLTAVKCAAELTRLGTPAVPVFWLATEDHDLEEVNHTWVLSPEGPPYRLVVEAKAQVGKAVGSISIDNTGLEQFEKLSAELPHAAEAIYLARKAYAGTRNFGSGFHEIYKQLLSRFGVILLNPMQPALRSLSAPLLRHAIECAPDLLESLQQRGYELQSNGYHQQVHVDKSTSLFFHFENGIRTALKRNNGSYRAHSRAYSTQDLLKILESNPEDISPSALLRPVVQDSLLPTAMLVAGSSEAAYLGQSSVIYKRLLSRMPIVMPRASFTVLDEEACELLERYSLSAQDCFVPKKQVEARIAAAMVPSELRKSMKLNSDSIGTHLQDIIALLSQFDKTLETSCNLSRRKIEYQLSKIESKVARESLQRSKDAQKAVTRLTNYLYPNQNLQERVYGVLSFVAKFGTGFVDRIEEQIQPDCPDHRVLTM